MFEFIYHYRDFPKSVKTGFSFLIAGWVWLYLALYAIFLQGDISFKILIIGPLMCLAILKGVNWARMLCLLCNAMVIVWSLVFMAAFFNSNSFKFLSALITVILFAAASYYLLVRSSNRFFKSYGKSDDAPAPDNERPAG